MVETIIYRSQEKLILGNDFPSGYTIQNLYYAPLFLISAKNDIDRLYSIYAISDTSKLTGNIYSRGATLGASANYLTGTDTVNINEVSGAYIYASLYAVGGIKNADKIVGGQLIATVTGFGSGTITELIGSENKAIAGLADMHGVIVSSAIAGRFEINIGHTDISIVNAYGSLIKSPTKDGAITGNIGTIHGLYIEAQNTISEATAHYNLYSAGANSKNVFEGTCSSRINVTSYGASQLLTVEQCRGYLILVTAVATITLPVVAVGSVVTVYSTGANAIIIDPNDNDRIILNGATTGDGKQITSASGAGDYVTLVGDSADGWIVIGRSGVWTQEA